jgi:phage tail-like protein
MARTCPFGQCDVRLVLSSDRLLNHRPHRHAGSTPGPVPSCSHADFGQEVVLAMTTPAHNVVSAPRFALSVDYGQIKNLQVTEIKEIWSQLAAHEYIATGGARPQDLSYTKQYGQPKNTEVKVTVTFTPDTFPKIWSWHMAAKAGEDKARTTVELTIYKPDGKTAAVYTMEQAWLSKVDVTIPKAGNTDTATMGLTIVCDDFIVPNALNT